MIKSPEQIGTLLLRDGLISEQDLTAALELQQSSGSRLGEIFIQMGVLTPAQLLDVLGKRLNVKSCILRHGLIDPAVSGLIEPDEAKRMKVLPMFKIGRRLTIAMVEPQRLPLIDRLAALTGCEINPILVLESNLSEFADRYLVEQMSVDSFLVSLTEQNVEVVEHDTREEEGLTDLSRMDGSPVVNLLNLSIMSAIRDGASDIHIEPDRRHVRVRYRIDGVLHELLTAPRPMQSGVISRVKVLGKMDIAEKRLPQEGRVAVAAEGREVDLRISTMPTILGEKAVIRVLDRGALHLEMDRLGFRAEALDAFHRMLSRPHGLVLVTGPTGSGKTTTLYSALDLLRSTRLNIVTVEDPVEYQLDMINQIHVQEHVGLTFPRALRSILRQDPDVIMVGEIRDSDTARVAIQAALTGHLVLTTVHTKDCVGALARLTDMGIEPYLLASALNGVVAQRLARTVCAACRTTYMPDRALLAQVGWDGQGPRVFYRGGGCKKCHDSGFQGRIGIYEVVEMTDDLYKLIHDVANESEIKRYLLSQGFVPLREQGLTLVEAGKSTLEEVLRVTHMESHETVRAERKHAAVTAGA